MDKRIKVQTIRRAWDTCDYKLQVWLEKDDSYVYGRHEYILQTLQKWFGTAVYMWDNCYLCDLKAGR